MASIIWYYCKRDLSNDSEELETFQLANEYLHVGSLRCPAIFLYHFEIDWKRVDFLPAALPLMPIEKMQV